MKCIKCGTELSEEAIFCTSCGTKVQQGENSDSAENIMQTEKTIGKELENQGAGVADIVKKKRKTPVGLFIGLGAFAVLIFAGLLSFVSLGGVNGIKANNQIRLAERYMDDMDYESAIAAYTEAIQIYPKAPDAYMGLAQAYEQIGDYESAIAVVEDGLDVVSGRRARELEDYLDELEDELDDLSKAIINGVITIADADMNFTNNQPLEGAKIRLSRENEYEGVKRRTESNEYGEYEFENILPGEYTLSITKNGYLDTEQTIVIEENQEVYYNATLEAISDEWDGEGTASGRICDVVTGYGVEGLTLKVREGYNNVDGKVISEATTDQDGYYITDMLDCGLYTMEVVDERNYPEEETYCSSSFNFKIFGDTDISNQDGTVSLPMKEGQIRIVLTWGLEPYDLDSHLFFDGNNGEYFHIYYSIPEEWFYPDEYDYEDYLGRFENEPFVADLDLDDTSSYGPETTTLYVPVHGEYEFGVYNFSHQYDTELANSGAMVQVYTHEAGVPSYTFYVPSGYGYYWKVFTYDSNTGILTPINEIMDEYQEY